MATNQGRCLIKEIQYERCVCGERGGGGGGGGGVINIQRAVHRRPQRHACLQLQTNGILDMARV